MSVRKPWEALTPRYRKRLEAKGVTAESHAAGTPLHAARGKISASHEAESRLIRKHAERYYRFYGGANENLDSPESIVEAFREMPRGKAVAAIREQESIERLYHQGRYNEATRAWQLRDKDVPEWLNMYHSWFA